MGKILQDTYAKVVKLHILAIDEVFDDKASVEVKFVNLINCTAMARSEFILIYCLVASVGLEE